MKILIVAATLFEVRHLVERNDPAEVTPGLLYSFMRNHLQVDLLTPGIGMLPTAYHLGRALHQGHYNLAINAGICGSYQQRVPPGAVVHVTEEQLPEPGVEENGVITSLFNLGLMSPDQSPFEEGKLVNRAIPDIGVVRQLPAVTGNTVNTLHTSTKKIRAIEKVFPAEVESMEGAAFFYASLLEELPFLEIRSVSNFVGERDKEKWRIREAVKNLDQTLQTILDQCIF